MVISDRTKGCGSRDLNKPCTLTITNLLNLTHTTRCGNGARVEPVRHRQTKRAATDMFGLPPLRHTPTLPDLVIRRGDIYWRETPFETLGLVRRKTAFTAGGHSLGGPSTEPGTIRSWR